MGQQPIVRPGTRYKGDINNQKPLGTAIFESIDRFPHLADPSGSIVCRRLQATAGAIRRNGFEEGIERGADYRRAVTCPSSNGIDSNKIRVEVGLFKVFRGGCFDCRQGFGEEGIKKIVSDPRLIFAGARGSFLVVPNAGRSLGRPPLVRPCHKETEKNNENCLYFPPRRLRALNVLRPAALGRTQTFSDFSVVERGPCSKGWPLTE